MISATLIISACGDPDRTDNLTPGSVDQEQYPGNDNEVDPNSLEDNEAVGSVQSYENVSEDEASDGEYDNIFRRDASDADNATVTDEDLDMPHTVEGEGPVPSAAGGGDGESNVADRGREDSAYGSGTSSGGTVDPDVPAGGGGAMANAPNQDEIGAQGGRNYVLEEYYAGSEESYTRSTSDAAGNSYIRPLDPAEQNYNEQVVRVGGEPETDAYMARYEQLKNVLYADPNSQGKLVYSPNNYTVEYVQDLAAMTAAPDPDGDGEVMVTMDASEDKAPLYGNSCLQADDPISCSSNALDADLRGFLNDPRVLQSMRRSGIDGVVFDVDEDGTVLANSVQARTGGKACSSAECMRFSRTFARTLASSEWQPGMRLGAPTVSRIRLPLRYRQTEEMQDLGE